MSRDELRLTRLATNLVQVDRELERLAALCRVTLPQPGVVARVLQRDASVCGTVNTLAFTKLRGVLALHFVLQAKFATEVAAGGTPPNPDQTTTLR